MKNYSSLLLLLLLLFAACDNYDNFDYSIYETDPECLSCQQEIAFPNSDKELLILPNGVAVEKVDSFYIFQGDILLTEQQITELGNMVSSRSTITTLGSLRWPEMKVYYTISPDLPLQNRVTEAIAHWEANTPFRFFRKETNNRNYIEFIWGSGCYSSLGMIGGRQVISLDLGCSTGNAIHEIGHAIGLFHEQCRPDRDNYINVHFQNIQSGYESQFDFRANSAGVGAFDFNSIMMYPSDAFSKNGLPTMTKKDGSVFTAQRNTLSTGDLAGVNQIYNPIIITTKVEYTDNTPTMKHFYMSFETDKPVASAITIEVDVDYSYYESIHYWDRGTWQYIFTIPQGSTKSNRLGVVEYAYYDYNYYYEEHKHTLREGRIKVPATSFDNTHSYVLRYYRK